MRTPRRLSAVHNLLAPLKPQWGLAHGMQYARHCNGEDAHRAVLGLADLSHLPRSGAKGPQAAAWLASRGLPVPARPNSWLRQDGTLIARLGASEFLVEGTAAATLTHATRAPGVYPVLREDCALALLGPRLPDLLAQTCNVNFAALDLAIQPVVLTSMAGVTVTVLPHAHDGAPFYRVWCDYSYGPYLWRTLLDIVRALGGGAVGAEACPT